MKLNFWQWLGVILLIIGVALWLYKKSRPAPGPSTTQNIGTAPVVQPTR
jgi:drug/metabolite transporter (DMT)-like permease